MQLLTENSTMTNYRAKSSAYCICCGLIWIREIFELYVRVFLLGIFGSVFANIVSYAIIPITILIALKEFKPIKLNQVFLYGLFIVFYLISLNLAQSNEVSTYLQSNWAMILLHNVPLFFVGLSFADDGLYETLHMFSRIGILINFLGAIYIIVAGKTFSSGDTMGFAYYLLPHILMVLGTALTKKAKIDWLYFLIGIFILFSYGTRGPILFLGIFVIILLLFNRSIRPLKKVGYILLIAVAVFLFYEMLPVLINLLARVSLSGEKTTRILQSIVNGSISDDNGRIEILNIVSENIKENIFQIRGLAFDRAFYDRWGTHIAYSHNLGLEIIGSFGLIIGSIILLCIVIGYIHTFKTTDSVESRLVYLAMFCSGGFLKLFLSGSFLMEGCFFLLLGYCAQQNYEKYAPKILLKLHSSNIKFK